MTRRRAVSCAWALGAAAAMAAGVARAAAPPPAATQQHQQRQEQAGAHGLARWPQLDRDVLVLGTAGLVLLASTIAAFLISRKVRMNGDKLTALNDQVHQQSAELRGSLQVVLEHLIRADTATDELSKSLTALTDHVAAGTPPAATIARAVQELDRLGTTAADGGVAGDLCAYLHGAGWQLDAAGAADVSPGWAGPGGQRVEPVRLLAPDAGDGLRAHLDALSRDAGVAGLPDHANVRTGAELEAVTLAVELRVQQALAETPLPPGPEDADRKLKPVTAWREYLLASFPNVWERDTAGGGGRRLPAGRASGDGEELVATLPGLRYKPLGLTSPAVSVLRTPDPAFSRWWESSARHALLELGVSEADVAALGRHVRGLAAEWRESHRAEGPPAAARRRDVVLAFVGVLLDLRERELWRRDEDGRLDAAHLDRWERLTGEAAADLARLDPPLRLARGDESHVGAVLPAQQLPSRRDDLQPRFLRPPVINAAPRVPAVPWNAAGGDGEFQPGSAGAAADGPPFGAIGSDFPPQLSPEGTAASRAEGGAGDPLVAPASPPPGGSSPGDVAPAAVPLPAGAALATPASGPARTGPGARKVTGPSVRELLVGRAPVQSDAESVVVELARRVVRPDQALNDKQVKGWDCLLDAAREVSGLHDADGSEPGAVRRSVVQKFWEPVYAAAFEAYRGSPAELDQWLKGVEAVLGPFQLRIVRETAATLGFFRDVNPVEDKRVTARPALVDGDNGPVCLGIRSATAAFASSSPAPANAPAARRPAAAPHGPP